MFNNIIYFIVVLLIFNIPVKVPATSLPLCLIAFLAAWAVFAICCRWGFEGLLKRFEQGKVDLGRLTANYYDTTFRLSVLAIFIFALAVFLFGLKYWIGRIPWAGRLTSLQGLMALLFFFSFLSTLWYFAHPVYRVLFTVEGNRRSFIQSNLRFNIPILFPWLALSLIYDLLELSPWAREGALLNRVGVQILFFAVFLLILMVFMPKFVQSWWGCKPIDSSEKGKALESFLREKDFRYRSLVKWPIFEGRMMTAGIMGIVPRYRYILITDSLLEILSPDELKAVLAHEMGHAKYRHLLFYILFFIGYMVLSLGISDLFFYLVASQPLFVRLLMKADPDSSSLFYLVYSIPMLASLLIYFRFVMGFFMRNFERQADLYSATTMGTPAYTIGALEKIALLSGKSRDLPSWHHFSIRQRVEYLWRSFRNPGLVKKHHRFVAASFLVYLLGLGGLGYFLNFSSIKKEWTYGLLTSMVEEQLENSPTNLTLYQDLAMIYHERGDYQKAMEIYEKIIRLDPSRAVSLNNLAWLLLKAPNQQLRNRERALLLAKRAVGIRRSPIFLDTLAEAYYVNGKVDEAVRTIREALASANENRSYYEKQLKKFLAASGDHG